MSSDTPRTDAEVEAGVSTCDFNQLVNPDFARTLERELAAMMKERDALRAELDRINAMIIVRTHP